jgi:hypothetical protein
VILALCVLGLAAAVVVLYFAGFEKNAQITRLREHGVDVEVTVTSCMGLMGGSGSNLAGYDCKGTFRLNGRRYRDSIPGTAPHPPGSRLVAVTVAKDPSLLSTPAAIATQRASGRVYLLPSSLLIVLVGVLTVVMFKWRSLRRGSAKSVLARLRED